MSDTFDAPAEAPECELVSATGEVFSLDGRTRVLIGRGHDCDFVVHDHRISRHHASIELVCGQHLLRDAGSANGTFLNGLRVGSTHAFALRAGDTIEIGAGTFVYEGREGTRTPAAIAEGSRHELGDLLADGEKELSAEERAAIDAAASRALAGVSVEEGLERALSIVVDRLVVTLVAIFVEDPNGLRTRAARPSVISATALLALARCALRAREGRILLSVVPLDDPGSGDETACEGEASSAAVPFDTASGTAVLAVQRSVGHRLDRRALSVLAVIARAIGRAML